MDSNGQTLKSLTWVNIRAIVQTNAFSKLILNILKKLLEVHNNYPLAPDEIETKKEMLSDYKIKIADHYDIPIGNAKKIVSNFSDQKKYVIHY